MAEKRVLFIVGSFGLGHVTRDLAIVKELRRQNPGVEVTWLATPPASTLLEEARQNIHPLARQYSDENVIAEETAAGTRLDLVKLLMKIRPSWSRNVEIFKDVVSSASYDLVVGDGTYGISAALKSDPGLRESPYAVIYDFIGVDALTNNPFEKLVAHVWNRRWSKHYDKEPYPIDMILFVGELEDIPDRSFGFLLPQRRAYARARCNFVGYILQFAPLSYRKRERIREELGYDASPLVVCSIGGTAIGKELLQLCAEAYPMIKETIPDLKMVFVCGPRLSRESIHVPGGVEIWGYVPKLYEHFAACDLAIVQAGGTTTLELTALRKPFLYFPLEDHFEQQVHVAGRLARHGAGVKMSYSKTSPSSLAEAVIANIGKDVDYPHIPTDGAQKAAELLTSRFLEG
jgi:UDP:flavonoid glycosyltransferase YjiC (YdhE family)